MAAWGLGLILLGYDEAIMTNKTGKTWPGYWIGMPSWSTEFSEVGSAALDVPADDLKILHTKHRQLNSPLP